MSEKKSWREVYKVHPAADLFPMLPEDELRKLGEDIKANGLKEKIILWSGDDDDQYLLDGRNRLDAMELVGMETVVDNGKYKSLKLDLYDNEGDDPYTFVISKNIRRRHLTKEQQADRIVKVMKMKAAQAGLAEAAKSVKPRNEKGQLQGQSTKDPFKEKVVEEAKKHGISKRTAEKAIAKDKGPTQKAVTDKPVKTPSPEPPKWTLEATLKRLRLPEQGKPSRRQLENENLGLLEMIVDLKSELTETKRELVMAQMQSVFNVSFGEWEKIPRL
jgi:hypothetical protein